MSSKKWEEIKRDIVESHVWKAIFRHGYEDTPRNRVLMVTANVFLHLHPAKVRRHGVRMRFTWSMGGLTFLMFLVTVVTGIYLMFYYRPVSEYAYADMKYLEFDMPFGMLMRNMHRWSAHAMIVFVWLHMFRVFLTGSYKPPREFNWVVGVLLLVLTLLLSFTGYLLPWDQLSIWAVTVGSNMARATPLLGNEGPFSEFVGANPIYDARAFLSGAGEIGPHTLLRFYILHCLFIPILASVLMTVHFLLIPTPSKALWYFLGLQEMLVYFDPSNAGVVMPSLILVGLMVIPFIDINPKGSGYYCFKDRKYEILTFFLGFHVLWVSMIMIGTFFRGPGWNLFWPWQRWDPHKVVALTNIDLPYLLGFRDYKWSAVFGRSE